MSSWVANSGPSPKTKILSDVWEKKTDEHV